MVQRKDIGKRGEDEAFRLLKSEGYQILERNYRFKRSEIDLIAEKDGILVFIEVKVRSNNSFGFPESFVSDNQINHILAAAEEYQYQKNWNGNIRFDIISIEGKNNDLKITHFKDAFH